MKEPTEVFLVTQHDSEPDFYHPAKSTKMMSRHALNMKIKSQPGNRYRLEIKRAEIAAWEDVTKEFEDSSANKEDSDNAS